jgi:hypothetical protein
LFVASTSWIAASHIGDGGIVILTEQDELLSVTKPPIGEYANETTFLTSEGWEDTLQNANFTRPIRGVAAFSDGLQRLALNLPAGEPFPPFFLPLFALAAEAVDSNPAARLDEFLNSSRINARTDDDKTLLLATLC